LTYNSKQYAAPATECGDFAHSVMATKRRLELFWVASQMDLFIKSSPVGKRGVLKCTSSSNAMMPIADFYINGR
jgi:hypothetical protein